MAGKQEFGALIGFYQAVQPGKKDFIFFLLGLFAVATPLGYGLYLARNTYMHYGPVPAFLWSLPWYGFSVIALVVFVILIFIRLNRRRYFVAVHKNGLSLRLRRFNKRFVAWEEFTGIATANTHLKFLGLRLSARRQATLYTSAGQQINLDDQIQNFPELITHIKANLYPRLLHRLRTGFQAGEWLSFGPLAVHCQGIRLNGKTFPWSYIHDIKAEAGCLMVELNNKDSRKSTHQFLLSQIPNFEILLQLLQQGVNA